MVTFSKPHLADFEHFSFTVTLCHCSEKNYCIFCLMAATAQPLKSLACHFYWTLVKIVIMIVLRRMLITSPSVWGSLIYITPSMRLRLLWKNIHLCLTMHPLKGMQAKRSQHGRLWKAPTGNTNWRNTLKKGYKPYLGFRQSIWFFVN